MPVTSSFALDTLVLFLGAIVLLYKYATRKHDYWKKRSIFYIKPMEFFSDTLKLYTFRMTIGTWLKNAYDYVDKPFFGVFILNEPYLILKSPELIKRVLVKDFNYFMDRTVLAPDYNEMTSNMLFFQKSPDWKNIRPKMTPVFSSTKLKGMYFTIKDIGSEMNRYIRNSLGQLEAKEICAKFSTDVIAKCAFGIDARSFVQSDAEFRKIGRLFFDFRFRNAIGQLSHFFLQGVAKLFRLDFFEKLGLVHLADVFWEAIKEREENTAKGNDLIDRVVEIRRNKDLRDKLNFERPRVVAQALQFFTAGYETVSSAISFTLYELCIHPEMQDTVRSEIINSIKDHGGITYEAVMSMTYLDMCVKETVRKYPLFPFLDRRCTEDYKVPETDVVIEKGTPVLLPMFGIHYDEKFYPEPNEYDPERFRDKNSINVDGLYYIPFGEGPRVCLGKRFGLLATKLGLVSVLSEFILEPTSDTPIPLKFEPKSFLVASNVGLPMRFKEYRPMST